LGDNGLGQLGLGSTVQGSYWRTTRVGTASEWKGIAVGYGYVLAIESDASLWA
jgi:hypothetical protein